MGSYLDGLPPPVGGGGAPTDAPYVVTAPVAGLSAEVLLSAAIGKGLLAARPAAGISGRLYYVEDAALQVWQRDTGLAWEAAPPHYAQLLGVPLSFPPLPHAVSHQHLGVDEIATVTPGANAIPKAGGGNKLAAGWMSEVLSTEDLTDVDAQPFATGDLLFRSSGGKWVRLAIGADSFLLKVVGGLPAWAAGGGGAVTLSSVNIAFTDGDTLRRVTITDAAVLPASKIVWSIIRPDVLDVDDPGYLYFGNIVRRQTGGFDFLVASLDWGFDDPILRPPNETVQLIYLVA